jgi:hypothetical protein
MDPTAKPTAVGPPFEGQIKIVAELPPGLDRKTNNTDTYKSPIRTTPKATPTECTLSITTNTATPSLINTTEKPAIDLNLDLRTDVYEAAAKAHQEKKHLETCANCKTTSNEGYYHNTDKMNFVCSKCFDGLEKNTKADYTIKKERPPMIEAWTEQEEMLLLEGLEMYPEDWDKVAEHVSTQTRDACILHYLKLPMADPRIDPQVKKLGLLEFAQKEHVDNPIMSVVAFLAANVNPKVAASSIFQATDDDKEPMDTSGDKEKTESLEATYELIQNKISTFTSRIEDFEKVEAFVDQERRTLEKEKFIIRQEHLAIRSQMDNIYGRMFQVRQAKMAAEQQMRLAEQQQKEEAMPNDVRVRLPHESLSPEEIQVQEQLRARYPTQYLHRQQLLQQANMQQQQQQQQQRQQQPQQQQVQSQQGIMLTQSK